MPVYFAKAGPSVKIGWALNVESRIASLRCGCPLELNVVRTVDGPRRMEKAFHKLFRHRRVRGEWFIWGRDMLTAMPEAEVEKQSHPKAAVCRNPIAKQEIRAAVERFESVSHAARAFEMPRTVLTYWLENGAPAYRKRDVDKIIALAQRSDEAA